MGHTDAAGRGVVAPAPRSGVDGRAGLELFLISTATLLLELALIRWFPGKLRITAYFPNIVLIAAFLGLGVGALSRRGGVLSTFSVLVGTVALAILGSSVAFTAEGASEHLWLLYYDLPENAPVVEGVAAPLVGVFAVTTLVFVGLGAEIARRLDQFATSGRTLVGYALDLAGSLTGALIFLALSALRERPVVWFALALLAPLAILRRRPLALIAALGLGCATLALVHLTDREDRYSPYYGLRVLHTDEGVQILTNGSLHQQAMDLRWSAFDQASPYARSVIVGYRQAAAWMPELPRRALVLGAGSGNDVTVLLDLGVPEIHAVEIDPTIVEIGRTQHPARPYDDPRVTVHIADARQFLATTDLRFDLIIFGTLDSMTRLSAMSNVRLDNFVYTVESLQAARARLTERGGLALFFMSSGPSIDEHLYGIVAQAFEAPPALWRGYHHLFNRLFLAGPAFERLRRDPLLRDDALERRWPLLDPPTDDWPFLYLQGRSIPGFYLTMMAVVVAFALGLLFIASASLRQDLCRRRIDVEMMLFGAAFLLLETGFVTELNLLFGATWKTSAVVFAAILAAVLLSTLVAARWRVPVEGSLAVVVILLVVVAMTPLRSLAPVHPIGRYAFAVLLCAAPVCAAGLAFAARFAARREVGAAFGWNVLGAVLGGLCEFVSMVVGLRSLFLIAVLFYLGIAWLNRRRAVAEHAAA